MNTMKSISARNQYLAKWWAILLIALVSAVSIVNGQHQKVPSQVSRRSNALVASAPAQPVGEPDALPRLPLSFEVNRGQVDPRVRFLARTAHYTLFLTSREAVFVLVGAHRQTAQVVPPLNSLSSTRQPRTESILRMSFVDANPTAHVVGTGKLIGRINYLVGRDPTK